MFLGVNLMKIKALVFLFGSDSCVNFYYQNIVIKKTL